MVSWFHDLIYGLWVFLVSLVSLFHGFPFFMVSQFHWCRGFMDFLVIWVSLFHGFHGFTCLMV